MKNQIFCITKVKKTNVNKLLSKSSVDINNRISQFLYNSKNRSPIFKLVKIQKKNFLNSKTSRWTNDEDKILLEFGQKMKRNKWKKCSLVLNNKTPYQCYLRHKKINPNFKKGRWTEKEDQQVLEMVNVFGKSWKSISKIIKTRSNKQIRNRYEEYINEDLNKGIFTTEEDEQLISLFKICKNNWFKYKAYMKNRSIRRIKKRILFLIKRKRILKIDKSNNNNLLDGFANIEINQNCNISNRLNETSFLNTNINEKMSYKKYNNKNCNLDYSFIDDCSRESSIIAENNFNPIKSKDKDKEDYDLISSFSGNLIFFVKNILIFSISDFQISIFVSITLLNIFYILI